jgi:TonB family protein
MINLRVEMSGQQPNPHTWPCQWPLTGVSLTGKGSVIGSRATGPLLVALGLVLIAASPLAAADGGRLLRDGVDVGPLELRAASRPVPPAYRYTPAPRYPMLARERRLEGVVVLTVLVRADGRVEDVRVASSSGADVLDEAALTAVRTWRFAPATRSGRPVESLVEVPVKFALRSP